MNGTFLSALPAYIPTTEGGPSGAMQYQVSAIPGLEDALFSVPATYTHPGSSSGSLQHQPPGAAGRDWLGGTVSSVPATYSHRGDGDSSCSLQYQPSGATLTGVPSHGSLVANGSMQLDSSFSVIHYKESENPLGDGDHLSLTCCSASTRTLVTGCGPPSGGCTPMRSTPRPTEDQQFPEGGGFYFPPFGFAAHPTAPPPYTASMSQGPPEYSPPPFATYQPRHPQHTRFNSTLSYHLHTAMPTPRSIHSHSRQASESMSPNHSRKVSNTVSDSSPFVVSGYALPGGLNRKERRRILFGGVAVETYPGAVKLSSEWEKANKNPAYNQETAAGGDGESGAKPSYPITLEQYNALVSQCSQ